MADVIFFGGSDTTNINNPGPQPSDQTPVWTTDQSGRSVHAVPYPGNTYVNKGRGHTNVVPGKTQQAINAQGLLLDDNVDLIAYSSGTESALMYAQWRLENGQDVNSIVLLGPTFETSSMDFDNPDGGWSGVMDDLISQGVNIYVLDDGRDRNDTNAASGYSPLVCQGCGVFTYQQRLWKHYSDRPKALWGWLQGTNNKPSFKKEIYSWLASPQ